MAYRTILLKGDPLRKEAKAGGAITPGHLIEKDSSGDFIVHATAGGNGTAIFAIEDSLQGNGVDDAYSSGNRVHAIYCKSGDEVAAILTTSQTIAEDDLLESNGDGTLKAYVAQAADTSGALDANEEIYPKKAMFRALEAVTTTDSTARIAVEVV